MAIRHFLGGHNAENITKCIKNIICEYKIESKISFIVTGNAANIINVKKKILKIINAAIVYNLIKFECFMSGNNKVFFN